MTTSSEAKSLVFESGADGRLLSQFTLRPSKYDIAVAALSTTTLVSFFCLISSVAIWIGNKPGKPRGIDVSMLPAVMLDGDGGWEDGTPGATPNVESPEDPSLDPSLAAEASSDVTELMNIVETVQAFDDSLTGSTQFSSSVSELGVAAVSGVANDYTGLRNAGVPGSAEGTGGRPLGS